MIVIGVMVLLQFDLIFPDGVSIATNGTGDYMINATESIGNVLSVNKLANVNGYQILFEIVVFYQFHWDKYILKML